jgi:O-succinylbenzoic acid--CoA ligase
MSELSIFAAAHDAGSAPALRDADHVYTFADLADLVRARLPALARDTGAGAPFPLVATNTLDTVITLYALLEAGIPALLVHPRLTMPERATLLATAAEAGIPHPQAAVILQTSGTTGAPRAAVLTRPALVASATASAANLGWQDDDCWLLCLPIARVGGLSILTRCLAARRCVALHAAFDPVLLPHWVAEEGTSLVSLVPTMLVRILDAHPDWTCPTRLRAVLLGGAAASPRLLARALERRLPVVVTYGLTETCSQVTATRYDARFAPADEGVGMPLPDIAVRIANGHIEVKGATLMAGYWNEPPLASGTWFDTGDLGTIDAHGCLHVHSRRTDLIVTGGENVYPAEVEAVLETFPGIAAAGVFGVPDEIWGQTVAAALVTDARCLADAALLDHVDGRLAPYKRPRHVCFVPRLPQTAAGKLDRAALANLASALHPLLRPGTGKSDADL